MAEFEPRHLLKFTGDPNLELYYRCIVYNHKSKDTVNDDKQRCSICNTVLSIQERPRLKPRQRMTKTIQKLIAKKSKKIPLSRIELFKLNKFMNSSQQMVVRCSQCSSVNKLPTVGRQDLIKLRSKLLLEVEKRQKEDPDDSMRAGKELRKGAVIEKMDEGNELITVQDPVTEGKRKKKKKKKNKNNKGKDFIATLIQQKAIEKKAKRKSESISSPAVSLQSFMLLEAKNTPSPSHSLVDIDTFRRALNDSPSSNQTAVCQANEVKAQLHSSTAKASSQTKKLKKKSKNDNDLRQSLFFETPKSDVRKRMTSNNQTPVSAKSLTPTQQQTTSKPVPKKLKKKVIQKELRKYLSEVPQSQEKSSSLKDFLTLL